MKSYCITLALTLVLSVVTASSAQGLRDRGIEGKEAKLKVPAFSGIVKVAPNPPDLFFTSAANNCSSFDLAGGTLNYVGGTFAQVYPLHFQGQIGPVSICWEASPYGWVWYFEDRGGNKGAVYYQTAPGKPIREFDLKARKLDREP